MVVRLPRESNVSISSCCFLDRVQWVNGNYWSPDLFFCVVQFSPVSSCWELCFAAEARFCKIDGFFFLGRVCLCCPTVVVVDGFASPDFTNPNSDDINRPLGGRTSFPSSGKSRGNRDYHFTEFYDRYQIVQGHQLLHPFHRVY